MHLAAICFDSRWRMCFFDLIDIKKADCGYHNRLNISLIEKSTKSEKSFKSTVQTILP